MNAYGYVVTFSTPDGERQVRTRAWNAMDAATQSILEVGRDYADGAATQDCERGSRRGAVA